MTWQGGIFQGDRVGCALDHGEKNGWNHAPLGGLRLKNFWGQLRSPIQIQITTSKRWQMPWNWQRKSCPRPVLWSGSVVNHPIVLKFNNSDISACPKWFILLRTVHFAFTQRKSYKIYKGSLIKYQWWMTILAYGRLMLWVAVLQELWELTMKQRGAIFFPTFHHQLLWLPVALALCLQFAPVLHGVAMNKNQ